MYAEFGRSEPDERRPDYGIGSIPPETAMARDQVTAKKKWLLRSEHIRLGFGRKGIWTLSGITRDCGVSYPTLQRAAKGWPVEFHIVERLAKALDMKTDDVAVELGMDGRPIQRDLPFTAAPAPAATPAPVLEAPAPVTDDVATTAPIAAAA